MNDLADIEIRLNRFLWFSRCGIKEDINIDLPYRMLNSWQEASAAFLDPTWEETTAEAQGKLTEHLSSSYPNRYQGQWNRIAKEVRVMIDNIVMPVAKEIKERNKLSQVFLDCVQWDTLHGVMELIYADHAPHSFFRTLMDVYKQGHFPCGWLGKWPAGGLLVVY